MVTKRASPPAAAWPARARDATPGSMTASDFKARCLQVMEDVAQYGEPVVITKRGKPIARLVAVDREAADVLGCLAGVFEIVGDIEAPVSEPSDWNALR